MMTETKDEQIPYTALPVSKGGMIYGQIYPVLANSHLPMMAQWRPFADTDGVWWGLGMSKAQMIEKGITHYLVPAEIVYEYQPCNFEDHEERGGFCVHCRMPHIEFCLHESSSNKICDECGKEL
jgi:hypothetical protein